jgi:predicted transcriptional regulator of viral defense system
MTDMSASLVWKRLNLEGVRVTDSRRIEMMAAGLGRDPVRTIRYLQEHGYIVRLLRGIFYVKTPDERMLKTLQASKYDLIRMAMKEKGVRHWHLGLNTATAIHGMTHEYFSTDFVITDSFRTTKTIKINGSKFRFVRRGKALQGFGVERLKGVPVSDKEKTVLDLVHSRIIAGAADTGASEPIAEFEDCIDARKVREYAQHYPSRVREVVGRHL